MQIGDGYRLSEDPSELDLDRVFHWLSYESYWARGRERQVVEHAFAGSSAAGSTAPPGRSR